VRRWRLGFWLLCEEWGNVRSMEFLCKMKTAFKGVVMWPKTTSLSWCVSALMSCISCNEFLHSWIETTLVIWWNLEKVQFNLVRAHPNPEYTTILVSQPQHLTLSYPSMLDVESFVTPCSSNLCYQPCHKNKSSYEWLLSKIHFTICRWNIRWFM